jgi:tricorn protease
MLAPIALLAMAQFGDSAEMRLMRFPTIHGDTVVFTYAGDLWSANTGGGLARRLTSHAATEQAARFSPDGKWIAFTGAYEGNPDVYVIPSEGGEPKRLTYQAGVEIVRGWTPDGKIAYITPNDTPGAFTAGLRLISPKGGPSIRTKLDEVADVTFSPDGKQVAFNRNNSHNFNWRRYRGGTQGRIAFSDLDATTYKEIPGGRENRWQPMWIGNKVYYIGDKTSGTRNLWVFDTTNGRETQVTKNVDGDIKWPSTDGKSIVYERDGYLNIYDVATGEIKTISPRVAGDHVAARPRLRELGGQLSGYSLSPSGNRILVEARGEIFSVPARTGETRHIGGDSSSKEHEPNWSPDGKTIAFMSDKSGSDRIYTMPQMGGDWSEVAIPKDHVVTGFRWAPDSKKLSYLTAEWELFTFDVDTKKSTLVVKSKTGNPAVYDWSPDSKWIAFVDSGKNLFGSVSMHEVDTGKTTQVTEGYYRDDSISFDGTGKYLFLISARTFNPTPGAFEFDLMFTAAQRVYAMVLSKDTANPMLRPGDEEPAGQAPPAAPAGPPKDAAIKVDLDGIGKRLIPLPFGPADYAAVVGINNGVLVLGAGGSLTMFDFGSRQPAPIIAGGVQALDVSPSRTKMAYLANGILGITDIRPGIEPGTGRVNLGDVEFVVDPRKEWKQIYWEAWRWERDRFYDPKMLGLDWIAIGKKYEKFLPYVSHRTDLSYVLGLMIGELGTGHAYVQGGDLGDGVPAIPTGSLGADYDVVGGKVKFAKIYRGNSFEEGRRGPLGDPGVNIKDGEYLLAIDGVQIGGNDPNEHLVNKVNRPVKLTVNDKPTMDGSRVVEVRPIASEADLRYIEWVEDNRRKVAEMSGGRIGYIHVPDTQIDGMIEFIKGYYSQSDKEAVIIDERFNGGGFIPTFFIEKLARSYMTAFRARRGDDVGFPPQSIEGPKAMLINEYAGSGGDLFPFFFRQSKLGPLIGTRTWGGLVGITGGAPLVDGGGVTAPEFGLYDLENGEWIAENKGVDPDIAVDNRPDLLAKGRDPQLEKGVEYLLNELKKGPRKTKRPDFPVVKGGGGK